MERGSFPSLMDVAHAVPISKSGLLHHFPSRVRLLRAIVDDAIAEVDAVLTEAAARGEVVSAWLRISAPDGEDLELFQALATVYVAVSRDEPALLASIDEANRRWERLLQAETGDPVRAHVIRLVGDGLLLNALSSDGHLPEEDIDAIVRAVLGTRAHRSRS